MDQPNSRWNPLRLLLLAAVFHVAVTLTVFLIGHFRLLPNFVDETGIGVSFAVDGVVYRNYASQMVFALRDQGLSGWLELQAPLHCRLYSVSFAIFGWLFSHSILTVEPLNLIYYLGILTFVYLLGREIFNPTAGLLAATIVGVWPSFLLNTTQLIRDPLANFCMLGVLFALTLFLTREFRWRQSVILGLASVGGVTVFWLARGNMWNVVVVSMAIASMLLFVRMVQKRHFLLWNTMALLLLWLAVVTIPARVRSTVMPNTRPPRTALAIPSSSQPTRTEGVWERILKQIDTRRSGFQIYEGRSSNIDSDVRLQSAGDLLRYTPRAATIGFFAPFPNMWLRAGSYGLAVRIGAGVETLMMYLLYLPAMICMWRERRRLPAWLLFLVATIGMVGLGLVVINIGALFRLRYLFWILMIVLAAEGTLSLFRAPSSSPD